ncbi:MAG: hypothetical protein AB9835_02375 [Eubacteriales bacterium]
MWYNKIRVLMVRAITLIPESTPQQLDLFDDAVKREKRNKIDTMVESIRMQFEDKSIPVRCAARGLEDVRTEGY